MGPSFALPLLSLDKGSLGVPSCLWTLESVTKGKDGMAKGKQRAWNNLDGLYRDVEDARRHAEHGTSEQGAAAWERWLELIDIAMYALGERDDDDVEDVTGDDDSADDDGDGPDEGRQQLALPGTGRVGPAVPRGTAPEVESATPPLAGTQCELKPVTFTARGDKRRGT